MAGAQIYIGNCLGRSCIEPEYGRAVGKAALGREPTLASGWFRPILLKNSLAGWNF
jgi:hypothetical protein